MSNSSPSNARAINLGVVMKALENPPAGIKTLFLYYFENASPTVKLLKKPGSVVSNYTFLKLFVFSDI